LRRPSDTVMEAWILRDATLHDKSPFLLTRFQPVQMEMAQLGAEGVLDTPHIPDLGSAPGQAGQAPPGEEAVGGQVTIHFAGAGVWCRGEVLAFDAAREVRSI
jgi:hypothetical protein